MRLAYAVLAVAALAAPALAQDRNGLQGSSFGAMTAQEAARLNHAVRNDPQARQALDQVEKKLSESGHRSGHLLEKTRP